VRACLYHVQLNVGEDARSLTFYRELFGYLEYRTLELAPDVLGFTNGTTDFWVLPTPRERRGRRFHRKNTGLNHLAFGVRRRLDVDDFVAGFLRPRAIPSLYGTPRHFPEYHAGYYAVFFEDPDRLKLEVAHVPGVTDGLLG
jgi:catechol 2,3-dioxygenase-like lactoylglutathione lyase family enzyme